MYVGIRLNYAKFGMQINRTTQRMKRALERFPKELSKEGVEELSRIVPRGSSTQPLADSFYVVDAGIKTVRISTNKPYAIFVDVGARPSPGRYIPAIGKRLINPPRGMHPGMRGVYYRRKLRSHLHRIAPSVLKRVFKEEGL